jgi:hypothetical protein
MSTSSTPPPSALSPPPETPPPTTPQNALTTTTTLLFERTSNSLLSASTHMTQSLQEGALQMSLSIQDASAHASQAFNSTQSVLKTWIDPLAIDLATIPSSLRGINPESVKKIDNPKTLNGFLQVLIQILFDHQNYGKQETQRYVSLFGKLNDKNYIFPLDRCNNQFLLDLRKVNNINKSIQSKIDKKNIEKLQKLQKLQKLSSQSTTQTDQTDVDSPKSNIITPNTQHISDPTQIDSTDPTSIIEQPIESQDDGFLPLPIEPQFTFCAIPSSTAGTIPINRATMTENYNGKGVGDLLSFMAHTVERSKEITLQSNNISIRPPDLIKYTNELNTLKTELIGLEKQTNSIIQYINNTKNTRESTRNERISTIKNKRIQIDEEFKEKYNILEKNHKEKLAALYILQNTPIVLPSLDAIQVTDEPLIVQQQRILSNFFQPQPQPQPQNTIIQNKSTPRINPLSAPPQSTIYSSENSLQIGKFNASRPGTANSKGSVGDEGIIVQPLLLPDVVIGGFNDGNEDDIENMIADMLSPAPE